MFYTRGTDRAVDQLSGFVRDALNATEIYDLLDQGSRRWNALQSAVKNYVIESGGIANESVEFYKRPNFQEIKDFFDGKAQIDDVIQVIPCN
ncbi:hypothetical protein [Mangrovivirga cuniculi]|nr:hypothetical protein [Mangrovivirga cuniculi]